MTDKSDWKDASRELRADERRKLGDPPTAEELQAYYRGELSEQEEDRIRDLIVAYPELVRMYREPAPDAPRPGDSDYVGADQVASGWRTLQQRLRQPSPARVQAVRGEAQRGVLLYVPTAVAAVLAVICFGLYVRAEGRARYFAEQSRQPLILAAAQQLDPDGNRGSASPLPLRKDGEAYLLKPVLVNEFRYSRYQIELRDSNDALLWSNRDAHPADDEHAFQIVVPHTFLTEGQTYRLGIFGVDGQKSERLASYEFKVPVE
ncbi:MAG TPA: hypothetical protein VF432_22930 [Thermoanaerobaculia bacterium]